MIETVQSNLIQDNGSGFFIMDDSQITQFQGNQITANEDDGIRLLTATIEALRNNTIVRNGRDGIVTSGLAHVNATNNIIVENGWYGVRLPEDSPGTLSPNLAYNDIWNNGQGNYRAGIRPGITDIHVDPLFVDPDNRDYHLQATSPLIGAGENGVDIGAIPAVIRQMEILGSPARAGETITFRIVAEPNAVVSFSIEGVISDIPMPEIEQLDSQAGMPVARYQGEYTVSANDRGIDVPLILRVETTGEIPHTPGGYIQIDTSQSVTLSGGIQAVEVAGSPAKAGGEIEVTLLADAGGAAEFSIARIAEAIPMMETADGNYQGRYAVEHGDNADDAPLTVVWIDKEGRTSLDRSQTVRIDTITVRSAGSPARAGDVLTITAAGKSGSKLTFHIEGLADTQMGTIPHTPEEMGKIPRTPEEKQTARTVQYPRELLRTTIGTSYDCALLYAALLGNSNVPVALMVSDEYILVLFQQQGQAAQEQQKESISWNGKLWVPVDIRMLKATPAYAGAKAAGLEAYENLKREGKVKPFILTRAWEQYKPVKFVSPQSVKEMQLGIVYVQRGEFDKAEGIFNKHLNDDASAAAYNNLGNISLQHGRFQEAESRYGKALEVDPGDGAIYLNLGIAYAVANKGEKAAAMFDRAFVQLGSYVRMCYALGIKLDGLDHKEVRSLLQEAEERALQSRTRPLGIRARPNSDRLPLYWKRR